MNKTIRAARRVARMKLPPAQPENYIAVSSGERTHLHYLLRFFIAPRMRKALIRATPRAAQITRLLCAACLILLTWQAIVTLCHLPSFILPAPKEVFVTLYQQRALLTHESIPTLLEIFLGLVLGVASGCLAGIITAYFRPLKTWLLPILILSQAVPTFVIAPLLVIWFGYGLTAKIITSMLMIFFPVASATYDGLHQTPPEWLALARTMNARPMMTFFKIRLRAALPAIASGIRIAAAAAPLGAIVGEWVGASHGLGYLMLNANARMEIPQMFAAVILLIGVSLLLYFTVDRTLKKIVWWVN